MSEISVIVPVYKVEKYINRCVDSILDQSFKDFDLILVDDGSPDNCPNICDCYANIDKRVLVIHKENGGLASARNCGIEYAIDHSTSKWITFIDSDDWIHVNFLKELHQELLNNNLNIAKCCFTRDENVNDIPQKRLILSPEDAWRKFNTEFTMAWGGLFQKSLFSNTRFPEGRLCEDAATMFIPLFSQERVLLLRAPLYSYTNNPNGIVNTGGDKFKNDQLMAFAEQRDFFLARGYNKAAEIPSLWIMVCDMRKKRDSGLIKDYKAVRRKLRFRIILDSISLPLPLRTNYYTYRAAWPRLFSFLFRIKQWLISI